MNSECLVIVTLAFSACVWPLGVVLGLPSDGKMVAGPRPHLPAKTELGACSDSMDASDVCMVCNLLSIRDLASCCKNPADFEVCDVKFSAFRARLGEEMPYLEEEVPYLGDDTEEDELRRVLMDKRKPARIFRGFNRAWYKGKRGSTRNHGMFTKFNRIWFKNRG